MMNSLPENAERSGEHGPAAPFHRQQHHACRALGLTIKPLIFIGWTANPRENPAPFRQSLE
jgi:hypothetical protein